MSRPSLREWRRPSSPEGGSPPARRIGHPRWREPRLWIGILLVAGSVAIGARIGTDAAPAVAVWQVTHDVPQGGPVDAGDVRTVWLPSSGRAILAAYLPAGGAAPQLVAVRPLTRGELVPRSAVQAHVPADMRQVPLAVASGGAPADLAPGDRVDVWVEPSDGAAAGVGARLALSAVLVVSVAAPVSSDTATVLVAVSASRATGAELSRALGAIGSGSVVLVRRVG